VLNALRHQWFRHIASTVGERWLPDIGNRLSRLRWFEKNGILSLELTDEQIERLHKSAQSSKSEARKLGLCPGKWKPRQWINRLLHDHLGVRFGDGGYCSPEADPLYGFISNRLDRELADFSQNDRTQTLTPQAVEVIPNDCLPNGVDNSHSPPTQTLTPQAVEADPVAKNLHGIQTGKDESPIYPILVSNEPILGEVCIISGPWAGMAGTPEGSPFQGLTGEWRLWLSIDGTGSKSVPLDDLAGVTYAVAS
jgi:hypothetical protein